MPDGRRIGRLDHIFKGVIGLVEAQIIQDSKDHCSINVVFTSPPTDTQIQVLLKNFKIRTASQISVDVNAVEQIPRGSNGKFRNVVRALKETL